MTQPPSMIRPEALDKLPYIDETTKATYKTGLTNLWKVYEGNVPGSAARSEAETKIKQASARIMQQMRAGNRPTSGNGQPQQQQQRPAQAGQANGQAGQAQAAAQGGNQAQQVSMQRAPSQQGQPQQQAQQVQPQQGQQGEGDPTQAQAQLAAKIKQTVLAYSVFPDPTISSQQQFDAYKVKFQNQYGTHLLKRDRAQSEVSRIRGMMQAAQQNGTEVPEDWKAKGSNAQAMWQQANADAKGMEQKNEQNKLAYQQKQQQQAAERNQAQAPQANGAQVQNTQRPNTQQGQGVDVKMESRMSNSPPQPQNQFQGLAQNQGTPVQQQTPQQLPQQQQSQPPSAQQQQNTPQTATQPQMPQQTFPQQNMQQQPQRPQLNAQQMQHHSYGQQQPQQYQTPQSALPQNNMTTQQPQQPQRPQALSQRDAIGQAQQSYIQQNQPQQNQQTQQSPTQQMPQAPQHPQMQHANSNTNMSFNTQHPQSANNQQQNTPTGSQFPTTHISSSNTKFPIPKTLNLDPRTQQPVAGPSQRPTMMNQQGMLHAPGIQKPPPFTLEGEGDHVLSKRKLDELVRQVTGSTAPEDGLEPEVEESCLGLADSFVIDLITKSCQLAKLRGAGAAGVGGTLDIKDVQMVLERNYGIRVPGYGLDETRTVRKFQPAPGWVQKVQAVQAGKVMGGKDV